MTGHDRRLRDRTPELLAALLTGGVAAGVTMLSVLVVVSLAAVAGFGGGTLGLLVLTTVALGVLGGAAVAAAAWLTVARGRAALARGARRAHLGAYRLTTRVEDAIPLQRGLGLSALVAPDVDTRIDLLKREYAAGRIDEDTFERRVADELDVDGVDRDAVTDVAVETGDRDVEGEVDDGDGRPTAGSEVDDGDGRPTAGSEVEDESADGRAAASDVDLDRDG